MSSIENTDLKSQLIADFQTLQSQLNGKSLLPINQLRSEAMNNFEKLGFPTIRHEEWKYSNVSALAKQNFNFHADSEFSNKDLKEIHLPHLKGNVLYFINGVFHAELSHIESPGDYLKVVPFAEAQEQMPEVIDQYFAQYADYKNDAFTALNTALAKDGVVVHIADNKTLEEPVILRFIGDTRKEDVGSQVRNLIVVGKNAEGKIAEAYRTIGDNQYFINTVTEFVLFADARLL